MQRPPTRAVRLLARLELQEQRQVVRSVLTSCMLTLNIVVFDNTQSGSAIANDTLLHCAGGQWFS
jgi:hypothetical protein